MTLRSNCLRAIRCLCVWPALLMSCAVSSYGTQFPIPGLTTTAAAPVTAVDWYIDATLSMQGFVRTDRPTFIDFEKLLERQLHSEWSPPQVTHTLYRFGQVANSFDNLGESWTPSFYTAKPGFKDTDLLVVGQKLQSGHVVVILTDLFQTDKHIEPFRAELLKRGLGKTFQFAILALRCSFNGTIYDIPPPSKPSMQYQGPRPVYALILGPGPGLQELLNAILAHSSSVDTPLFTAMFSTEEGAPVTAFHDLSAQENGGSFHATDLDPDEQLIQGGPRPFTKELRLSRSAHEPRVTFDEKISLRPYEALPPLGSFHLDHASYLCGTESSGLFGMFSGGSGAVKQKEPCVPATSQSDILYSDSSARVSQIDAKTVDVQVKLDFGKRSDSSRPIKARSSQVYAIKLTVNSRDRSGDLPSWVADFSEIGGHDFKGTKTPDLADFLSSMQDSVNQVAPVTLLNTYLFVDSK